jgi:hypothetical protein
MYIPDATVTPTVHLASRVVDIDRPAPPVEWIIPNIAARAMLTVLSGQGGTGKTSLLLQLAAVYGAVHLGRAAMISAENVTALHILANSMGIGSRSVTVYRGDGLNLSREEDRLGLELDILDAGGLDLLVLDSLVTFAPGCDTNGGSDMSPYLDGLQKMAEKLNAAVVVIHHWNRSGSSSGSHAIRDRADFTLDIAETAEPDLLRIRPDKWRLGPKPNPWHVRRIAPVHGHGVLRYEPADAPSRQTSVVGSLVEQLRELECDGPQRLSELGRAVGLDTASDTDSRKLRRSLDQLVAEGEWEKLERGFYAPVSQPDGV